MTFSFLTSALIFYVVLASVSSQAKPEVSFKILKPRGFRLSIPHEDGIKEVTFKANLDRDIEINEPGDFSVIVTDPTNNAWIYDNPNTKINTGNVLNYWVQVMYENGKIVKEIGTTTVSEKSETISNECPDVEKSENKECPVTEKIECDPSVTTVGGRPMCKGQLIFEDTFDKADWTKWSREVRMPLAADDGQFVMFLDRNENCNVKNGQLHIVPSLSTDVLGNDVSRTRRRDFNLGARCTAVEDKPHECRQKAQFYQILPPVISARINTKKSFSFRYGKVEVRAKLPKGDWLFPLILLEPLEHFYGMKDYASGQIRIAFSRGNEILLDSNSTDISHKSLSGGAVLSTFEKYRNNFLRGTSRDLDLSAEFHTYSLTWTEEQLLLEVDGFVNILKEDFSKWQEVFHGIRRTSTKMAPFDREFYLTLGVSAGGHADFPDNCVNGRERKQKPWRNGDPKAQLFFWKDTSNWFQTWKGPSSGLHVDYVRVYAL